MLATHVILWKRSDKDLLCFLGVVESGEEERNVPGEIEWKRKDKLIFSCCFIEGVKLGEMKYCVFGCKRTIT